jgi:hypothetical protein
MSARAWQSLIVITALVAAAPACAQQLYKWVDEKGVTNYSNQPPDPKAAKNVKPVEDRLSVYSPDPGLAQAIQDNQKNFDQRQREREKVQALEQQLQAERRARDQAASALQQTQLAYEKCVADGRGDCSDVYGVYPPYTPLVVVPPRHRRHIPQPVLQPGTTAGNVTADNGFIPGNSASARNNAPVRRESGPRGGRSPSSSDRLLLERR